MKKEDYTLLDLAEIFGENKQLIRRRITKLKLVAINKDTREHYNEPLKYNYDSYLKLAKELGYKNDIYLEGSEIQSDTRVTQNVTRNDTHKKQDSNDKDILIEILERELEHSKDKLKKSEEEKEKLMTLLDQQQRLSLQANQKIEMLEAKDKEINNKKRWYDFLKRKK